MTAAIAAYPVTSSRVLAVSAGNNHRLSYLLKAPFWVRHACSTCAGERWKLREISAPIQYMINLIQQSRMPASLP
jgi:hypothetical protein